MGDEGNYKSCIGGRNFPTIHKQGFIGVTASNAGSSNINELDVEAIDFFNLNEFFYQHEHESDQDHIRDESGYLGATAYPWSAKLDTIALGEVAFDVLE